MQSDLFGDVPPSLPEGFRYKADAISQATQDELLAWIPTLPFKAFDFHGFEGKRRIVSLGLKYDFALASLQRHT